MNNSIRLYFVLFCLFALTVFLSTKQKQQQWQRAKKLNSVIVGDPNWLPGLWLSDDPNHFYADLDFSGRIDFYDYSIYLKMKGL